MESYNSVTDYVILLQISAVEMYIVQFFSMQTIASHVIIIIILSDNL